MLTKTLPFGLGKPLASTPKGQEFQEVSDEQRKAIYRSLKATSRLLAQSINILNAREYIKRIMDISEKDILKKFRPSNTRLKMDLKELGIEQIEDISGATLSQAYMLGSKPDFSGEHGKQLLLTGERQLPTHRIDGTHPIFCRGKESCIILRDKKYFLVVQIFSKVWAQKNKLPSGWISFPVSVKKRDKTLHKQMNRILDDESDWTLKNSRILKNPRKRGNRWLGQIVVSYTPEPFKKKDLEVVMGIDLGVTVPAAVHITDHEKPNRWAICVGRGKDMLHARNLIRGQIVRILRALRSKVSPLTDKTGRKAAKEKLRNLRKKEKRIMKTASQRVAARIADIAKRNGAGVWQMEDLSADIKEESPWLCRNWAPGMLLDAIRWQAEQLDVKLEFLNPQYTSQRCSKCGNIDPANRPKGKSGASKFKCVRCGFSDNADKNAARNLSIVGIEKIIADDPYVQQRKEAKNLSTSRRKTTTNNTMAPNGAV